MERPLRTIALLLLALVFIAVVCAGFVFILAGDDLIDFARLAAVRFSVSTREDDLQRTVGSDPTPIRFTVNLGDSPPLIAQNLFSSSLILDAELFSDYVQAEQLDVELEAGTYFLNQTQTIPQIANALTDSRSSQIIFTILEGWRMEEIAAAIDTNPLFGFSGEDFSGVVDAGVNVEPSFAQTVGLPEGASLEGFLYPDTYSLPPDITAEGLRDLLTEAFLLAVGDQLTQDAANQGFSLHEMVTLASIIEREAVQTDEQPLIASAYRNRLEIGQKLDADPTVQYPLGTSENWWPRITAADYAGVLSIYNTYLYEGFPPGPIANPGLAAIRAAIYPAESDYFYFRADCRSDGYHDFATTYDEHLANGC